RRPDRILGTGAEGRRAVSHCVPPRRPKSRFFGMADVPAMFFNLRGAVPISVRTEGRTPISGAKVGAKGAAKPAAVCCGGAAVSAAAFRCYAAVMAAEFHASDGAKYRCFQRVGMSPGRMAAIPQKTA